MVKEKDIVFDLGSYWVLDCKKAYQVMRSGATVSTCDSAYSHNEDGKSIAVARCKYLARKDNANG